MNSFKLMYSVPLCTNGDEKHDKTNAVLKLQNISVQQTALLWLLMDSYSWGLFVCLCVKTPSPNSYRRTGAPLIAVEANVCCRCAQLPSVACPLFGDITAGMGRPAPGSWGIFLPLLRTVACTPVSRCAEGQHSPGVIADWCLCCRDTLVSSCVWHTGKGRELLFGPRAAVWGGWAGASLFFTSEMDFHSKQFFNAFIQRHSRLTRQLRKLFTPFPGYC